MLYSCFVVVFRSFSQNFPFGASGTRAQISCYELKGDLSPVIPKKIFHDTLKISKFTRICMENHFSVTGWQKLFFSDTNPSNFRRPLQSLLLRYTPQKIYKLPNFNMLFQFVLTNFSKANCFRGFRKLIT